MAGPDDTATVTLTPAESGYVYLWVTSRTADGVESGQRTYWLIVG